MTSLHTLESLLELAKTPEGLENIRVIVAELCGITVEPCTCAIDPWRDTKTKRHLLPYATSLDAMAEAENLIKGLGMPFTHKEAHQWLDWLIHICSRSTPPAFTGHCKPWQRAIAFILTKQS